VHHERPKRLGVHGRTDLIRGRHDLQILSAAVKILRVRSFVMNNGFGPVLRGIPGSCPFGLDPGHSSP
jgi:hypothetical protein